MSASRPALAGFDPAFTSLENYIRVITARIWEGREIDRIHDWYASDCAVITPGGTSQGVSAVVKGTLETLTQFPDRRLLCEDIVHCGSPTAGFLSSHRIASPMTHRGPGSFGPPTGLPVFVRTVADCVCRDNRIVHEWLVRDQGAIARAIGQTPESLARRWLVERGHPVLPLHQPAAPAWWRDPQHETAAAATLRGRYQAIWHGDLASLQASTDEAVQLALPSGETGVGLAAAEAFWFGFTAAFAGARLHIDSLIELAEMGRTPRVAMRWRVTGHHLGSGRYGVASGAEVEVLGITHAEVDTRTDRPQVLREWILVDEVALWMQILSASTASASAAP